MKITSESQLVDGELYVIHSTFLRDCEECVLIWKNDGFELYEHSEYSRRAGCDIGGFCGGFEKRPNLWYETKEDGCEITGAVKVIGEL